MNESASLLLHQFQVVDSKSPWNGKTCDIWVENGEIKGIAAGGELAHVAAETRIEGNGACISPGWMDLLAYLSDPGMEWKESLEQFTRAAAMGGFTDVICYPGGAPAPDQASAIDALQKRKPLGGINLWFAGEVSEAGKGKEMSNLFDMHLAGAQVFTDGIIHPVQDAGLIVRALQYLSAFGGRFFRYPVTQSLTGDGQMNEGVAATFLGFKGSPELAERVAGTRDLDLLEYAGGKIHFQPLTSPTLIQRIAAARKAGAQATVAVSALHLSLDDTALETFDTRLKVLPPIRDRNMVEGLKACIVRGEADALCSMHQAQGPEEKEVEFGVAEPGMLNLHTAFSLSYKHLVAGGHISLERLTDLWTHGPRQVAGLPPLTLTEGAEARLTCFDPRSEWTFSPDFIRSRAKNTWFEGHTLPVKVLGVIAGKGFIYNGF